MRDPKAELEDFSRAWCNIVVTADAKDWHQRAHPLRSCCEEACVKRAHAGNTLAGRDKGDLTLRMHWPLNWKGPVVAVELAFVP